MASGPVRLVILDASTAGATSRTATDIPDEYPTFRRIQTSQSRPGANVDAVAADIVKTLVVWEQHERVVGFCEPDIAKLRIARQRLSMSFSERDLTEHCRQKDRSCLEHFRSPTVFPSMPRRHNIAALQDCLSGSSVEA
jgi:hypothetical protein